MPRISESEIERIKRETDLASLVRSRGIELNKHGTKDLAGKCPFHKEDTASFIVTPDKGLFHCMGCGAAGNCIQFVEKIDGVSFRYAFELLNGGKYTTTPGSRPRLINPLEPDAEDSKLFAQVLEYYHERLQKTPAALDYLKGRGLLNEEALKTFKLGFADRSLPMRMPEAYLKEGSAIRQRLQKLGLYRATGHEHFTGSVVVPVFDEQGRCVEMYGRKVFVQSDKILHLYLPGPHAGIWNLPALDSSEIILCEAAFDALTFWVNGLKNVTFIFGTEGFPDYLFEAILQKNIRRVRLAYDADEAGNRAAERDAKRFLAHGIEVFRVKFPLNMDANEYARKVQPASKSLELAVRSAEPMGKPLIRAGACASSLKSLAALPSVANEKTSTDSAPIAPIAKDASPVLEKLGEYYVLQLGPPSTSLGTGREYRVGGLDRNNSLEVMKVSVRLRHGDAYHLDSFDMTRDVERRRYIERAAEEAKLDRDIIKHDLGKLLLALEREQEQRIAGAAEPASQKKPDMMPEERAEALDFLKAPDLIDRITKAFPGCGLAGEALNSISAYLACTSRKLDKPLAVIIQSTTAAGKSTLMDAVLAMFPEEERIKYSAMTGQSLYYLGETDLKHKILAIVEEEGAEKASYALKLLQSEGELTIASTGKDPQTGRMETQEYHVEGPVMIFLTTTAVEIDEELMNRCIILTVDESKEQTERIHSLQRKARTLDGLVAKEEKKDLLRVLRNAQRLLQPLAVVNPYADELTFTAERTRTRRDHEKYLTLIDAIALLHQHQRPAESRNVNGRQVPFIRATLDDIALANRLAPVLLGRSLDELPPQTRRMYEIIKAIIRKRCEVGQIPQSVAFFSRREIRSELGWSITQIRAHLERLRELEYIEARYGRTGSAYQYELLTDCQEKDGSAHIGLLDVQKLQVTAACPAKLEERSGPLPDGKSSVPHITCREKEAPVGGCWNDTRQPQLVEESALMVNLSA